MNINDLSKLLKKKRGAKGIREVAREIDVSPATLSRVERGNLPDLQTFAKICAWADTDPSVILGLKGKDVSDSSVIVSFRKDATVDPALSKSLANMILLAKDALRADIR